jgi:hypothetical protein
MGFCKGQPEFMVGPLFVILNRARKQWRDENWARKASNRARKQWRDEKW